MPEIILLGAHEAIVALEPDDIPADGFPYMPCNGIHTDIRAQLYANLLDIYFDEAQTLEQLICEVGPYGPFIYLLDQRLMERLVEIDEDDVDTIARNWAESGDTESLGVYDTDLTELLTTFLFNLIHFCLLSRNEPELDVVIYSDV